MKLINALVIAALVLFAAGSAHADDLSSGADSRLVTGGADPPPAESCTGFQASGVAGAINTECTVEGSAATSITFAVPTADVVGPLTCVSSLTNIGWTTSGSVSLTIGGVASDACTFTAPTSVSLSTFVYLLLSGDPIPPTYAAFTANPPYNDGDCDLDDFTVGIPVGCDIFFSTSTDQSSQLFETQTPFEFDGSPDGVNGLAPFPEPSSLAMLLLGLVPLAFLRGRALGR